MLASGTAGNTVTGAAASTRYGPVQVQLDTVSGATFTSRGYVQSLQSVLDLAHL